MEIEKIGRQLAMLTASALLSGCAIPDDSGNYPGLKPLADEVKTEPHLDKDVTINKSAMVKCFGANACKGMSACKTAKNSCQGKNACKGKGFIEMSGKACMESGGRLGL